MQDSKRSTGTRAMTRKQKRVAMQAAKERREAAQRQARRIVEAGKCPHCGAALRRNLALSGWWQCEQFGAEGFRKDSTRPSCDFQCFTE